MQIARVCCSDSPTALNPFEMALMPMIKAPPRDQPVAFTMHDANAIFCNDRVPSAEKTARAAPTANDGPLGLQLAAKQDVPAGGGTRPSAVADAVQLVKELLVMFTPSVEAMVTAPAAKHQPVHALELPEKVLFRTTASGGVP